MNKVFSRFLIVLALLLSVPSFCQTILTNTTLASAITDAGSRIINLTSATGVNAPSATDNTKATFLFVDHELMDVRAVNGTLITVVRGANSTLGATHANSAVVYVIPAYLLTSFASSPNGSCTRANELAVPRIVWRQLEPFYECLNSQWVRGEADQTTRQTFNLWRYPDPGGTAYTALETNGTAPSAATEQYCTEIDLPWTMLMKGIAVLNGTTVGTDKHLVILYDSAGTVLANSATGGALSANASTYQKYDFTAKYLAVGPNRYFACVQTNGTTDTIRHALTSVNDHILGGAVTGQVFGTVAAVTLPSTFTTAKAPYFAFYQ